MLTKRTAAYQKLVAKGCLCGTDRPADCPLHEPGDNRGIAAFYKAGLPLAFPLVARCHDCHTEGLMYPNIDLDDPKRDVDPTTSPKPTLICPRCSRRGGVGLERALVDDAESFGYELNDRRVFA